MKKIKVNYKALITILSIVLAVVLVSAGWYLAERNQNKWELKEKNITFEYGTDHYLSVNDVVDVSTNPNINDNNIRINFISNINELAVGEYEFIVEHTGNYSLFGKVLFTRSDSQTCKLIVVDTVAPQWENCPFEVECVKDCKEDFTDKFTATDLTNVTISIDDKNVDYSTVGSYEANAFATDEGGNVINQIFTVKVVSPTIKLSENQVTLYVGSEANIEAEVVGKDDTVTWSSEDDTVASVKNGVVTANKAGITNIVASANDVKDVCEIVVKEKNASSNTSNTSSNKNKENGSSNSNNSSGNSSSSGGSSTPNNSSSSSSENSSNNNASTCTNNHNHSIGCGNIGGWYSSRDGVVGYYNSINQSLWEQYQSGEISYEEYGTRSPYGYECWSCSYCGKWTGNLKYR